MSKHYCPECDQRLADNSWWCKPCQRRNFEENFDNWTSGDKQIDDFIKKTQMEAEECDQYIEWISFDDFINVVKADHSEAGILFAANWSRGPLDIWDPVEGQYVAKRNLVKVGLQSFVTREFTTSNYMLVSETVEWDLRHYMSHHFARLTWNKKISILHSVASALEMLKNEQNEDREIFRSHVELPVSELGLGNGKELIPVIVAQLRDWHIYKKQQDQFDHAEKVRLKIVVSSGFNPNPNNMQIPLKTHPQAIYTKIIKFMQRRETYPIKEMSLEDEDIMQQYGLTIPSFSSQLIRKNNSENQESEVTEKNSIQSGKKTTNSEV
ncbi:9582_t:CDS:2 [Diversispora eburnea]|uniref:9582_t:CDS:1 n=1 Tax=Diversispora eburnea TaxID=1213867 RepID=A0A9N8YM16_9GLOM|nr:9582_t:CDS:2 [Diversispora eburnea]